jgi:hypothetical protein
MIYRFEIKSLNNESGKQHDINKRWRDLNAANNNPVS